jgi:uncharacterized protein DUF1854
MKAMLHQDFASILREPDSSRTEPTLAATRQNGSSDAQLDLDAALRLWLRRGETPIRVKPVRCFPWSAPGELVSLRDEAGGEQLLVERLADLDALSARALETALLGTGFVLEVQSVDSIEEDYEIRIWHTETRHGRRTFQTRLDEWPWASPDGGHLVRDLAGDLFRIPPIDSLDDRSRDLLWAYVG